MSMGGKGCLYAGDGISGRAEASAGNFASLIYIGRRSNLDINELTTLIGSVGFPIVMCIYMTVTFNKTLERLDDRILALSTRIDTLIDKALEKQDDGK